MWSVSLSAHIVQGTVNIPDNEHSMMTQIEDNEDSLMRDNDAYEEHFGDIDGTIKYTIMPHSHKCEVSSTSRS